ncbi:hypothetical protein [Acinetobacter bereziniae]|uniref:hypothetical protein n=1 Tax=Acinetobacter bereziniae TaxID=106648 RepID=UPI00125EC38F|nr:hypothetical protein [Acinetobacter bereziniae]
MNKYDWSKVDWSQAPEWAVAWVYCNLNKTGYWCKKKPIQLKRGWCTSTLETSAPSFGFKGNWQDSLEERPHDNSN